jgi:hypothetical protein
MFSTHPMPSFPQYCQHMNNASFQLCPYWPRKLLFRWGVLSINFAPTSLGSCSLNRNCSLPALPLLTLEAILQMGSAPRHFFPRQSQMLICRYIALSIASIHFSQTTCSVDGKHSLCDASSHLVLLPCNFCSPFATP